MSVTEISFHDCRKVEARFLDLKFKDGEMTDAVELRFINRHDESITLTLFGNSGFIKAVSHAINSEFNREEV